MGQLLLLKSHFSLPPRPCPCIYPFDVDLRHPRARPEPGETLSDWPQLYSRTRVLSPVSQLQVFSFSCLSRSVNEPQSRGARKL